MLRYTLVRLGQAVLVLFVVATVVFMLSRASGNAAELMVPQDAPPETRAQIEKNLGLDKPLITQYGRYMKDLARGDLGDSFAYRRDVRGLIADALPNTIQLGLSAFVFAAVCRHHHRGAVRHATGRRRGQGRQGLRARRSVGAVVLAGDPPGADLLRATSGGFRRSVRAGGSSSCCPPISLGAFSARVADAADPVRCRRGAAQGPHPVRAGQGRVGRADERAHAAQRVAADRHARRHPARDRCSRAR